MKVVVIDILEGMGHYRVTQVYRVVMWIVFYNQSCSRVVFVVLKDVCQLKLMWKGWVGLLWRSLCSILIVRVLHVSLPVVIHLEWELFVRLSVTNTSQFGGTNYGTSELEYISRKKANQPIGAKVCVGSAEAERLSLYSRTETHGDQSTGRTKYYPGGSARTLLKDCFSGNLPSHFDSHQPVTGLSANQMI